MCHSLLSHKKYVFSFKGRAKVLVPNCLQNSLIGNYDQVFFTNMIFLNKPKGHSLSQSHTGQLATQNRHLLPPENPECCVWCTGPYWVGSRHTLTLPLLIKPSQSIVAQHMHVTPHLPAVKLVRVTPNFTVASKTRSRWMHSHVYTLRLLESLSSSLSIDRVFQEPALFRSLRLFGLKLYFVR